MDPIRVLIVDDHPEVRRALGALLGVSSRIEVLGTAQSFEAGVSFTESLHPDIVVIEPKSPARRRLLTPVAEMVRQLIDRGAATIILTSYPDEEERGEALRAGARRYLLKDIDATGLTAQIEAVAAEVEAAR